MSAADTEADLGAEIAATVRGVVGVAGLSAGAFGTVATPLPGGRLDGVALRADSVQVGVVVWFGHPIPGVTARIRAALAPLVPDRAIHVSVEDVVAGAPQDGGPAAPAAERGGAGR
ncbi:hypothetical protein CLV63_11817 [Murinocardiopsis flavida]|uniref:Uncharacterized protein n=1 Tax=Murinocardiopsis flavida TaxID=645275 RepID=A0A2P8D4W7_9ACTN|nr:hypothetical protein [Murinocardiopsis flavida]PSK92260.1 hypothetical protein CLV63_11817 [Murinocardiopsis flavida]